ncbi:MAG: 23S rRNA (adenine(2503)-C(2))-methyltransferase RlmN [Nitrospirota bacterium]
MKTNFKQLEKSDFFNFIDLLGEKPYRARQIINWIYKKYAVSIDDMTDISKDLRETLKEKAFISNLTVIKREVSEDGTQKFLFELQDKETIESVLIPNSSDNFTLCISSQAGCAMGCRFCTTSRLGLIRNLKNYEIVDQVIAVKRILQQSRGATENRRDKILKSGISEQKISNIVFMGMGEPLLNLDEVSKALWKLTDLMGFSKRKITVSTSGIVPKILELANKAPNVNLAVSLNAATDKVRSSIMPVNNKYPLKKLLQACREFPLPPNRRISFEYVMLDKINVSKKDALKLVKLLAGIKSMVNLIPYNPGKEYSSSRPDNLITPENKKSNSAVELKKPSDATILEFQRILHKAGIATIIRKSKGTDISAACGQLKAMY